MGQPTTLLVAHSSVGVVWALVNVSFCTRRALFTVAQGCKVPANRCARRHPDVSIRALRVRTTTTKEVQTSWGSVRRWFMGKIATYTCTAFTMQEFLANSDFVWVVDIETRRPFVAGT